MSDTDAENGQETRSSYDTTERMVYRTIQRSLENHKNDMLKEIGALFEKISDNSNTSQLNKISNMACDIPKFKRKSNEEQYKYNAKVAMKLNEAEQVAETNHFQCKAKITEAKEMIEHRQKLIQLADSSELGWRVVSEYESNRLADDSEDERRMYKAEARANRKLKAERVKKTRSNTPVPYRRSAPRTTTTTSTVQSTAVRPGLCFQCGKIGHWKKECPGISNNKMSY